MEQNGNGFKTLHIFLEFFFPLLAILKYKKSTSYRWKTNIEMFVMYLEKRKLKIIVKNLNVLTGGYYKLSKIYSIHTSIY